MKNLLFLLFMPAFLFGQSDYQCILSNAESFFESETAYEVLDYSASKYHIVGLKATDTIDMGDYVFYPFYHEFHTDDYLIFPDWDDCLRADAYSWAGPGFQIYANGLNIFFNRNDNPVFINTQANTGESWTFYSDGPGNDYIATVTDISEKEFLGVIDSVKTIEIAGDNSFSIEISKNYGLIKTINFRDFPGFGENTYQVHQYDIFGLSNPDIGSHRMNSFDIFDYDINDEIHWKWFEGYGIYAIHYNYIDKYIDKTIVCEDTIKYTIDRQLWYWSPWDSITHYSNSITVKTIVNQELYSGKLPHEDIIDDSLFLDKYIMFRSYNGRVVLDNQILNDGHSIVDTNCYQAEEALVVLRHNYYIQGVGSFHEYVHEGTPDNDKSYPVYFKKGNDIWGTPLTPPVGVNESNFFVPILISPNPANRIVRIRLEGTTNYSETTLEVVDISGKSIFSQNLQKSQTGTTLNVASWEKGIYFVIVRAGGEVVGRSKLVVD